MSEKVDVELKAVTNCWTVYHADEAGQPDLAEMGRPQDWGDPRWMYRVYVLEAQGYRNEVHCWHDRQIAEHEHLELFAGLVCTILLPGVERRLAGRDCLDEDDFWEDAWGQRPPLFVSDEDDFDDLDYLDLDPPGDESLVTDEVIGAAPVVDHPEAKILRCPECKEQMQFKGVMLSGNVLTGEPSRPYERWDCPQCNVMVQGAILDMEWGWVQWERQGNKRPGPAG